MELLYGHQETSKCKLNPNLTFTPEMWITVHIIQGQWSENLNRGHKMDIKEWTVLKTEQVSWSWTHADISDSFILVFLKEKAPGFMCCPNPGAACVKMVDWWSTECASSLACQQHDLNLCSLVYIYRFNRQLSEHSHSTQTQVKLSSAIQTQETLL